MVKLICIWRISLSEFDSQLLISFTSSLYVASLTASFFASSITKAFGHKPSILLGGDTFFIDAAVNVFMLICGHVLLGVGVGFANQSPNLSFRNGSPRHKGAINNGFQFCMGIGVLLANLLNSGTGCEYFYR